MASDFSNDAARLVRRALEPLQRDRYPSARAMGDALGRLARGEAVGRGGVPTTVRTARRVRRRWRWLAGAVATSLLVGLAVWHFTVRTGLRIRTLDGARVYVDDELVNHEGRPIPLDAGEHWVRITRDRFMPLVFPVRIQDGQIAFDEITLRPSDPADPEVHKVLRRFDPGNYQQWRVSSPVISSGWPPAEHRPPFLVLPRGHLAPEALRTALLDRGGGDEQLREGRLVFMTPRWRAPLAVAIPPGEGRAEIDIEGLLRGKLRVGDVVETRIVDGDETRQRASLRIQAPVQFPADLDRPVNTELDRRSQGVMRLLYLGSKQRYTSAFFAIRDGYADKGLRGNALGRARWALMSAVGKENKDALEGTPIWYALRDASEGAAPEGDAPGDSDDGSGSAADPGDGR